MDTDIMQQHIDLIVKNSTVDIIFALKQKTQCQHNWLIKDEHSGWLSRPGGRELKTVFCTKCLAETNI